jgi:hypothetical protein
MRGRSRTRRVAKWGVTSLLLLVIAMGGLSCLWSASYVGSDVLVGVVGGTLMWGPSALVAYTEPPTPTGFRVWWRPMYLPFDWPSASHWSLGILPLWIPAVVLAIATALLWYLDRRRIPPGHCRKCGYDLTGNVSGRCPECGTEIKSVRAGSRLAGDPKLRFDNATVQSRRDGGK